MKGCILQRPMLKENHGGLTCSRFPTVGEDNHVSCYIWQRLIGKFRTGLDFRLLYAFIAQESSESGWHSLGKNIIRCVLAQYHFLFSSKLVRIFHCTFVSRWVRTQGLNQAPHLCILGVFWETPDWIPSWSPLWECCLCQQLCSGSIGFSLNISYDIPASGMTNSSEVVGLCEDLWPGPWLWLYLLRGDWKTEFNDETVNASFWPSVQTWTRQWYSMWRSKSKRGARTYSL